MQMLTAADLNPGLTAEAVIGDFWRQLDSLDVEDGGLGGKAVSSEAREFADVRVRGVLEQTAELDRQLEGLLADWDLYRLGTVERAVLRLGAWELTATDVPPAVVINEAVDLANYFSTPKSRTLVNGVLDRLAKSRA